MVNTSEIHPASAAKRPLVEKPVQNFRIAGALEEAFGIQ
jgi:hypothetical protein